MARLSDYGLKDRDAETLRIEDIADKEVVIQSADVLSGTFGDYVVLQVVVEGGEIVPVMSGGMFVVDAVKDVIAKGGMPCEAKFFKRGRSWLFE